jgi:chromosome segregation ATPase
MLGAKRAKLARLEHEMHEKQKQYNMESNWLNQAESLVRSLAKKTKNVKLHLNDLHKEMTSLYFDEKAVKKDLKKLEEGNQLQENLKTLQRELQDLLSSSENVKGQIDDLNSKRQEYRSRIDEVKGILTTIKKKHGGHKKGASLLESDAASSSGGSGSSSSGHHGGTSLAALVAATCPCHLPITQRPHCPCY